MYLLSKAKLPHVISKFKYQYAGFTILRESVWFSVEERNANLSCNYARWKKMRQSYRKTHDSQWTQQESCCFWRAELDSSLDIYLILVTSLNIKFSFSFQIISVQMNHMNVSLGQLILLEVSFVFLVTLHAWTKFGTLLGNQNHKGCLWGKQYGWEMESKIAFMGTLVQLSCTLSNWS